MKRENSGHSQYFKYGKKLIGKVKKKLYIPYLFVFRNKEFKRVWYWEQHKIKNGNQLPNHKFYVIRKNPNATGLLSCYLSALGHLKSIEGTDYIPVMDIQTFYNGLIHNKDDEAVENAVERKNGWNYYFKNFSDYAFADIQEAKNIVLGKGRNPLDGTVFFDNTAINIAFLKDWYDLDRKYFVLNPDLQARFEKTTSTLLDGKRVLGVMIRDGYMVLAEARERNAAEYQKHPGIGGHPKQPTIDELIENIEMYLEKWQCEYVFVVAETSYVVDILRQRFGDRFITTDRERRNVKSLVLEEYNSASSVYYERNAMVDINTDYLEEIFVLSKCNALYAGKCSGSIVASLWNRGEYEHIVIKSDGLY